MSRFEPSPKDRAKSQLREDILSAISDAKRFMTIEELTQTLESILREQFMARVYQR
jgi:hypothetical protein